MKILQTAMLAALVACATSLAAGGQIAPLKGDASPNGAGFKAILNYPSADSLEELRGEVVIVKFWGVKCPPCIAGIPELNNLQKDFGGKGLHIFAVERQGHTPEQIADCAAKNPMHFPVVTGGFGGFDCQGLPQMWLIGVDGKVIAEGHHLNRKDIEAEIKKVKYPGLGKLDVAAPLTVAATAYVAGTYQVARVAAEKELAKVSKRAEEGKAGKDDEAITADAEFIVAKVTAKATKLTESAKGFEGEKKYLDAQKIYEGLLVSFKGGPEADAAKARLKEMKDDKEIQREIKAATAWAEMAKGLEKAKGADRNAQIDAFVKKWEGTRAAADAVASKVDVSAGS